MQLESFKWSCLRRIRMDGFVRGGELVRPHQSWEKGKRRHVRTISEAREQVRAWDFDFTCSYIRLNLRTDCRFGDVTDMVALRNSPGALVWIRLCWSG